jgi:hypothetical protein
MPRGLGRVAIEPASCIANAQPNDNATAIMHFLPKVRRGKA